MLAISSTKQFERDKYLAIKQGKEMGKLFYVLRMLAGESKMPLNLRDHPLKGNYNGYRECHIEPNWLLVYKITKTHLYLVRTGSHSEIFK